MTTLLILRHGPAEAPRASRPDAERALSPEGRRHTHAAMQRLVELGHRPHHIYCSPYLRARETAMALQEAGGCTLEVQADLTPQSCPERVVTWIQALAVGRPADTLALVSHEPLVSLLLWDLAHRRDELGLAGCAVLNGNGGDWLLEQVIRPVGGPT